VLEPAEHGADGDFLEIALTRYYLVDGIDGARASGPDCLHDLMFEFAERGACSNAAFRSLFHVLQYVTVRNVTCQVLNVYTQVLDGSVREAVERVGNESNAIERNETIRQRHLFDEIKDRFLRTTVMPGGQRIGSCRATRGARSRCRCGRVALTSGGRDQREHRHGKKGQLAGVAVVHGPSSPVSIRGSQNHRQFRFNHC
jgi:hypothetical protein